MENHDKVHYSSSHMSQDTHLKLIRMNKHYDMKTAVTTITVYKMLPSLEN